MCLLLLSLKHLVRCNRIIQFNLYIHKYVPPSRYLLSPPYSKHTRTRARTSNPTNRSYTRPNYQPRASQAQGSKLKSNTIKRWIPEPHPYYTLSTYLIHVPFKNPFRYIYAAGVIRMKTALDALRSDWWKLAIGCAYFQVIVHMFEAEDLEPRYIDEHDHGTSAARGQQYILTCW